MIKILDVCKESKQQILNLANKAFCKLQKIFAVLCYGLMNVILFKYKYKYKYVNVIINNDFLM